MLRPTRSRAIILPSLHARSLAGMVALGALVGAVGCVDDPPPEAMDGTTGEASSGTLGGSSGGTSSGSDSSSGSGDSSSGGDSSSSGLDSSSGGSSSTGEPTDPPTDPPGPLELELSLSPIKQLGLSWTPSTDAEYYQVLESTDAGEPFVPVGADTVELSATLAIPLHLRVDASYAVRACNSVGCTESTPVDLVGTLVEGIGYVKASNPDAGDLFGNAVALSGDGRTLAVAAWTESSSATGIDGDQLDDSAEDAGAVYVYVHDDMGQWSQQAYLKASNTDASDVFGQSIALSDDGSTLVVGANEDSSATGIDGNQLDDSAEAAGAAYVFVRDGMGQWSQQAYVKASNTDAGDAFGASVALSGDGDTLVVGALAERSGATGVDGDQLDNFTGHLPGAAYVFVRDGMGQWSQQAYLKPSNTAHAVLFGATVALDGNGDTLAVAAPQEYSNATGIDGPQLNNGAPNSGAVYVFVRDGASQWSQQAYVKASNTDASDEFGRGLALSSDGDTLAVGAPYEASHATGIDGDELDDSVFRTGATYVFTRDGGGQWSQQAYVKAPDHDENDNFGWAVALSGSGDVLAVAANGDGGADVGVGGDPLDDGVDLGGAVHVYVRDPIGQWSPRSYVKASNTGDSDFFGTAVALDDAGNTLAVGAVSEDSDASGVGGDQRSNLLPYAGAAYLY